MVHVQATGCLTYLFSCLPIIFFLFADGLASESKKGPKVTDIVSSPV